jgi:hypothetical protein
VVGLEGVSVGRSERISELGGRVGSAMGESLVGEVKTSII